MQNNQNYKAPNYFMVCILLMVGAGAATAQELVTGFVTYRERIMLPPDAVLEITLEDVSRADAMAVVLSQVTIKNLKAPPFAFELPYDPSTIDARFTYSVRATITQGGVLKFVSDTMNSVLTRGAPNHVEITVKMVRVSDATKVDASLINTYWRLVKLGDQKIEVSADQREPHITLHGQDTRYAATVGCNQFGGTFVVGDHTLKFGQGLATLKACLPPLDALERDFNKMLSVTQGWDIQGQNLVFFDDAQAIIATFESVYLQ